MVLDSGRIISGRYEIIEKAGLGGMAIVYKAKDLELDRYVAIKVLRDEYSEDEDFIKKFATEAKSAASLSHGNIVNVYDVGKEKSMHYLVMEYIEGTNLKEIIKKKAPFDNRETLGVSIQIAQGIQIAHKNNIIHKDIKPENILVTTKGKVKVTDFGIAQAVSTSTVTTDTTMGSVYYFSPEQARGGFVDFKSDIYSLGIVMYEMASGVLPYDGDNSVSIALKHLNDPMPDIKLVNPDVSDSIAKIIKKATQKKCINRYENIGEMINDLKMALKDTTGNFVNIKNNKDSEELKEVDNTEEKELNNNFKRKIIFSAILTALLIIFVISYFLMNYVKSMKPISLNVQESDFVGISLEQATSLANKNDLNILVDSNYDETVDVGKVISADLGGITERNPNQKYSVYVVVSLGSAKVEVEDYTGMNLYEVPELVAKNSMVYSGKYEWASSTEYALNEIISQDPKAGTKVDKGTTISFTVSSGANTETFTIPNFQGMYENEAKEKAEELGFKEIEIFYASSNTYSSGQVAEQTIPPGETAIKNETRISLIISTGKPEVNDDDEVKEPVLKTKTLEINFDMNDDVNSIDIKIYARNPSTGEATLFTEDTLERGDFPKTYSVKGKGLIIYDIYIVNENGNESKTAMETIDFDE